MVNRTLSLILASACVVMLPTGAAAQKQNRFALGVNFSKKIPGDHTDIHGSSNTGLTWRIEHTRTGWGWTYGFSWYSTDLDRPIGSERAELGELRIRPVM